MNYEKQTISIRVFRPDDPDMVYDYPTMLALSQLVEVEATIGIGSGLAYHRLYGDEEELYTLTCLSTGGFQLGEELFAENEEEARAWLEKVAGLTDWTLPPSAIQYELRARFGTGKIVRELVDNLLKEVSRELAQQR